MQTLIISSDANREATHANSIVVGTPLDAITRLERRCSIDAVVLVGSFAANDELAMFLAEYYPSVRLHKGGLGHATSGRPVDESTR
jgi:hypothetical protein